MTVTLILDGIDNPRTNDIIIVYGELIKSNTYLISQMLYTRDSLENILNDKLEASLVVYENDNIQMDYRIVGKVIDTKIETDLVVVGWEEALLEGKIGDRMKIRGLVTIRLDEYKIEIVEENEKKIREIEQKKDIAHIDQEIKKFEEERRVKREKALGDIEEIEEEIQKVQELPKVKNDKEPKSKTERWRRTFDKYRD